MSGFASWVTDTYQSLSPTERETLQLVCWNIPDRVAFDYWDVTFDEFMTAMRSIKPEEFRRDATAWIAHHGENAPNLELFLNDRATYMAFIQSLYAEKPEKTSLFNEDLHNRNFSMLQTPDELQQLVLGTIETMWERFLKHEWKRTEHMLRESAAAFEALRYDMMSVKDIVELVTNRDLSSKDLFEDDMNRAQHLVFVPSPHLGPYVSWLREMTGAYDLIFYGARLPKNTPIRSSELNRAELLVRLNALADETRLRMLEMLTREEEICAQDFITILDLSQSSASRHLRQLTASGYITERRRDVAKCYSLNRERIRDTMKALSQFAE
jgi:DNA-binding transcriptional ArsR family regulator